MMLDVLSYALMFFSGFALAKAIEAYRRHLRWLAFVRWVKSLPSVKQPQVPPVKDITGEDLDGR